MTYDPVTIYTFAMFSLLSGSVVCTQPTELGEIKLRYDDMVRLLGKEEPVELEVPDENYWPSYNSEKWPWASSDTELLDAVREIVGKMPQSKTADLQSFTMTALYANEDIETKYRLSRVKPKFISQTLLPF